MSGDHCTHGAQRAHGLDSQTGEKTEPSWPKLSNTQLAHGCVQIVSCWGVLLPREGEDWKKEPQTQTGHPQSKSAAKRIVPAWGSSCFIP